jgi:anion-transporting  ArsA/GET3 family ATPase
VTSLATLIEQRHIVICCGTGGVGKTTTAATLAIEGARRGRDTVVVTIDPAKRLANTLGLDSLSNTAHEVPRARWDPDMSAPAGGRLHALMLDTKTTFDQLVQKYAVNEEQAERILTNGFYRNIAGALSGTQEYMAMEKLYELHDSGGFDLVVVDTPPTRHALDFLDAPRRLTRMLDNRIFRFLMVPTRATLRVGSVAAQTFLRMVSRVVGTEAIDDIIEFFRAFEGMEEGFRERAALVMALLASDDTSFVLVTSPRRDAVEEAQFFAERLTEGEFSVDALIVNRVHPHYCDDSPAALRARAATLTTQAGAVDAAEGSGGDSDAVRAARRLATRYTNLAEFEDVAARERRELAGLEDRIGNASIAYVPELGHDVHDFTALRAVGEHLVGRG